MAVIPVDGRLTHMNIWLIVFGLIGVAAFGGCKPSSADRATQNARASASNCTFETPLKPGAPGSPGNLIPSSINPNGQSEMSYLMREMLADLQQIRARILANEAVGSVGVSHRRFRCAWPTDEGMRNPEFDRKAKSYLRTIDALEQAKSDQRGFFMATIGQCINCHTTSCPGPIAAIKKLQIPQ